MATGADATNLLSHMYSPAFAPLVDQGAIIHVTACYEHPAQLANGDRCYYTLQINQHTPKSDWDFFVLNSSRAVADVSLISGQLLRDEPHLHCGIQGRPDVVAALCDLRKQRIAHNHPNLTTVPESATEASTGSSAPANADDDAAAAAAAAAATTRPLGTLSSGPDCFIVTRLYNCDFTDSASACATEAECVLPLTHSIFSVQPPGSVTFIAPAAAAQRFLGSTVPTLTHGARVAVTASASTLLAQRGVRVSAVTSQPSNNTAANAGSMLSASAIINSIRAAGARIVSIELGPNSTHMCYARAPFPTLANMSNSNAAIARDGSGCSSSNSISAALTTETAGASASGAATETLVDVLMFSVYRGPLNCAVSDVIVPDWAGVNCSSWGVPASRCAEPTKSDGDATTCSGPSLRLDSCSTTNAGFHPLPGYALGFTLQQLHRDFELINAPFNPRYCDFGIKTPPVAATHASVVPAASGTEAPAADRAQCPWGTDGAHLSYEGWTFYLLKRRGHAQHSDVSGRADSCDSCSNA